MGVNCQNFHNAMCRSRGESWHTQLTFRPPHEKFSGSAHAMASNKAMWLCCVTWLCSKDFKL